MQTVPGITVIRRKKKDERICLNIRVFIKIKFILIANWEKCVVGGGAYRKRYARHCIIKKKREATAMKQNNGKIYPARGKDDEKK